MAKQRSETWRPSPELEVMLHAALDDGEAARKAWEQWLTSSAGKSIDDGAQRFYPLLYRNMQRLGVEHPELNHIAPRYRSVWVQNQLVMRDLEDVLGDFEEQDIPTLVLKGAALLKRYYKDVGTRTMADFDVLVPVAQTEQAMARLEERGWVCNRQLGLLTAEYRAPLNGMGFFNEKKSAGCDLHWYIFHLHLNALYDAPMWDTAVPIEIGKVQCRALCPEHQLIHLLFIGCMNEENSNKRWLPDALMVLKHEAAFDWAFFERECQRLQFVQPVAAMLEYLRREWKMPVPEETVTALAKSHVPYYVQQAYRAFDLPKPQRSGVEVFWLLYAQYAFSQPQSRHLGPLGFVRFISHRWMLGGNIIGTLNYAVLRLRGVSGYKARQIVRQQTQNSRS